ncbi:MAG: LicD family protein [Simkaniaceae bacterium]|nr:LicD family protein [Simkaniaceae bacterium]MCF7852538.1 LicD family protein [Simkaniaceae bacterium]
MNLSLLLKNLFTMLVFTGLPFVNVYHSFTNSLFFNAEITEATGLEKWANQVLIPAHYLLAGRSIEIKNEESDRIYCNIHQKYTYDHQFVLRTVGSAVALPISVVLGSSLKGLAMINKEVRERHQKVADWIRSTPIRSHLEEYQNIGISTASYLDGEQAECLNCKRRESDLDHMKADRDALKEVVRILTKHQILFWIDCGTCLGAYRYGGIIPWDFDVDLAILQPDFYNAFFALRSELDPNLYTVQDWSGRDCPGSYLKIYVKASRSLIDIYHFKIDPKTQTISSISSNDQSVFLPEWWKIRERRYTIPTPFEQVFPLKLAQFDGIVVPVPNQTKQYLQARYGENISPNRIYNEVEQTYEKDPLHPYWQLDYAH